MTRALAWRRLAAFGVDYGVIFLYLMLAVPALIYGLSWLSVPWRTHLLSFLFITLPVTLYFALSEASRRGATLGKRLLGLRVTNLRVTDLQGERLPLGQSLLRSTLKFVPWEVAHTASYRIAAAGVTAPWQVGVMALSLFLAVYFITGLFLGPQRTLYDRAAGAYVQRSHHPNVRRFA